MNMNEESLQSIREHQAPNMMTRKPIRCDTERCGRPAMCTLDLQFFCVDHFIAHCYERLNQCRPFPYGDPDDRAADSTDRFLQQCSDQAANLLRPLRGLDNLDRARLFDILLWASELLSKRTMLQPRRMASEAASSGD
jgi:hypothetical protein